MKSKSQNLLRNSKFIALTLCISAACLTQGAYAAALTWDGAPDGGGASVDANWSTGTNWVLDAPPAATGDTFTFAGTTGLAVNDLVTTLGATGTSLTFGATAGAFTLSGTAIAFGSTGNQTIISQQSTSNQVISTNLALASGGRDQSVVFAVGAGSLTLSGNVSFSNSWLFPTTTAGTIILSGNNSADGKGSAVTAGTNAMRATVGNNISGTVLVLGSNTALGNADAGAADLGTASYKGVINRTGVLNIQTTGGDRVLANTIANNGTKVIFNGTNNLTIGNFINGEGNKDFEITSTGQVTVSSGIFLSPSQTGRTLYCNLSGAGGMIVDGTISDTFHSGGLTVPGNSLFRKAGTGTLTLNGDSSSTFKSEFRIEAGVVKLGHPNALGATTAPVIVIQSGDTVLDSTFVTLAAATGVVVGQTVTGDGVPAATTVVSVAGTTIELSQAVTASASGTNLTFTGSKLAPTIVGSSPLFGTLDLNGQTIAEPISKIEGGGAGGITGALINTNTSTAAAITTDLNGVFNFTIDGAGDITVPRLIATSSRVITKNGNGTFTTNGSSHNNLCGWVLNAGSLLFENTSGLAADRGMTINGGTLRLSGLNSNLINDGQAFSMTGGSFDLNGKGEAIASISGTGGTITNNATGAATLYVGGGTGGSSTASFSGAIQDGSGVLNLTKEGSGTQTLTGTLAYSGNTTVSQTGMLSINSASLANSSTVSIGADAFLNLNYTGTDTVGALIINGVPQEAGEYGATGSGAEFTTDRITGDGRLQVLPPAVGYSTWASVNGASANPNEDHDADGVENGVEHFMGGISNTTGFTANPPVVESGETRTVTWPMSPDFSGTYLVQTSTNLATWSTATAAEIGDTVVYTFPAPSGKLFVRLVVTPN